MLNFAIPPGKLKHESILSEFETFWVQLENLTPHNKELLITCKAKLCDIAHAYSGTPIESKDFSLTRGHLIALSKLCKNKDIVICKPDKGSGVVILNKADYKGEMLHILNDDRKFCELGKLPQCDKTASNERKLQSLLLHLKKSNQINGGFYE